MSKTKAKRANSCTIGIDLGGTKVAAAVVDNKGSILAESRRPTVPPELENLDPRKASAPPAAAHVRRHIQYVVHAMAEAAIEALEDSNRPVHGIGLASAGPMNIEKGTLIQPSNFVGWKTVPLVAMLSQALRARGCQAPVFFQNDAIAAALGEGWVGRAQGCSTYAMITVGTGIGSGVIFRGQPAQSSGMGSEWGHTMIDFHGVGRDPDSFNSRSVEGIASGTGLIRQAKERGFKGESTVELAQAARAGDPLALELFERASEALAALLYTLSLGLHPEIFVVSGGMLGIKDLFLPKTIEIYRDLIRRKNKEFLAPVQVAKLGIRAGVIGAARLPYLAT